MTSVQTPKSVPGIPLAALNAVADKNVQDVLRALVDGHHVRNGQSGSGDERFVTAAEVGLGRGQSGYNNGASKAGGTAGGGNNTVVKSTDIGRIVAELQSQIIESQLFKDLGQRLSLIDAPRGIIAQMKLDLLTSANAVLAEYDKESAQVSDGITKIDQIMDGVIKQTQAIKKTLYGKDGALPVAQSEILAINYINVNSTSASAQTLAGLNAAFYDPVTGLPASRANYTNLINVEANARQALASKHELLYAAFNDPQTGLMASRTDYLNRIQLAVSAGEATARNLSGLSATLIDPATQRPYTDAMIATDRTINLTNFTALASENSAVYAALGTKNRTYFTSVAPPYTPAVAGRPYVPATATTPAQPAVAAQEVSPNIGDVWYNTADKNKARRWNGSSWQDTTDGRVAEVEGAIATEKSTSLTRDNVLVKAIATVWGALGGNSGLIQGGETVTVNTAGAQATAFQQVQAAVKDPYGNVISSAIIKQTTDTLVTKSGQIESQWVVNMDSGGVAAGFRQAGFGMSGSASANGPQYAFGVRADSFWVAAPGESGFNPNRVPFIVRTNYWYDTAGVYQPPGVYLNDLFATSAKIGRGQIKTADIGDAQIDTLRLAGSSVMVGVYDAGGWTVVPPGGLATLITRTIDLTDGYNSGVSVTGVVGLYAMNDASYGVRVLVNGMLAGDNGASLHGGYVSLAPVTGFMGGVGRYATVQLQVYNNSSGPGSGVSLNVQSSAINIQGAKR